jgi:hypothetical protein
MQIVISAYGMGYHMFLERNVQALKATGARVVVVSDAEDNAPEYSSVTVIKYKPAVEVFSLARTSNCGIRYCGSGVVIKSDPDIVFNTALLWFIQKTVQPGIGICAMCNYVELAEYQAGVVWKEEKVSGGQGGCMALDYSDWDKLSGYDERMYGWGVRRHRLIHQGKRKDKAD